MSFLFRAFPAMLELALSHGGVSYRHHFKSQIHLYHSRIKAEACENESGWVALEVSPLIWPKKRETQNFMLEQIKEALWSIGAAQGFVIL